MLEQANKIGTFRSWLEVSDALIGVTRELDALCPSQDLQARRDFVYGGLVGLNTALGWDHVLQPEDTENTVLWMFVQLFIR